MDVVVYSMQYDGPVINSSLTLVPFEERYYETYRHIYHDCFYDMRKALELQPYNACDSLEQVLAKKDDIFLLIIDSELVGSVAIHTNEIDDLIVAKNYQNQGYGKQLLQYAVSLLQTRNISPITLCVTEWNQNAISIYKNSGFIISNIETVTV